MKEESLLWAWIMLALVLGLLSFCGCCGSPAWDGCSLRGAAGYQQVIPCTTDNCGKATL